MKTYSDEEILNKVVDIWNEDHKKHYSMGWEGEKSVNIDSNKSDEVKITFDCMYEQPNLNLDVLMNLADFFGTKNINDDNRFSIGGCETCDYGSSYGFTLTVRPEIQE